MNLKRMLLIKLLLAAGIYGSLENAVFFAQKVTLEETEKLIIALSPEGVRPASYAMAPTNGDPVTDDQGDLIS